MNADEVKNEVESILENNGFSASDAENFFNAMSEMIMYAAEITEVTEPYATRTIANYRETAMSISSYEDFIGSIPEE